MGEAAGLWPHKRYRVSAGTDLAVTSEVPSDLCTLLSPVLGSEGLAWVHSQPARDGPLLPHGAGIGRVGEDSGRTA